MFRQSLGDSVIDYLETLYRANPELFANNFVDGTTKRRLFFVNVSARNVETHTDIEPLITKELRQLCLSQIVSAEPALSLEYIAKIRITAEILFKRVSDNDRWLEFWHTVTTQTVTGHEQQYNCHQKIIGMFMYKILDSIGKNAEKDKLLIYTNEQHILITKILFCEGYDVDVLKALEDDYVQKAIKNKLPINDLGQYMLRTEEENKVKFDTALNNWKSALETIRDSREYRLLGEKGEMALLDWLTFALNQLDNHVLRNAKSLDKISNVILEHIKKRHMNQTVSAALALKIQVLTTTALTIAKTDTKKNYESFRLYLNELTAASPRKPKEEGTFKTILRRMSFNRTNPTPSVTGVKPNISPRSVQVQPAPTLTRHSLESKSASVLSPRSIHADSVNASAPATMTLNTARKNLATSQTISSANTIAAQSGNDEKKKRRKSLTLDWLKSGQNTDGIELSASKSSKKEKRKSMQVGSTFSTPTDTHRNDKTDKSKDPKQVSRLNFAS